MLAGQPDFGRNLPLDKDEEKAPGSSAKTIYV